MTIGVINDLPALEGLKSGGKDIICIGGFLITTSAVTINSNQAFTVFPTFVTILETVGI
ncbi:MAG: hypothetical protein ACRCXY_00750 [Fusobacteriaceae bacterium]